MKIFLTLVVIIFSLQSWTKADDIRDFQIEGMSIGDSLQTYIDNNKFTKYDAADYFTDDKITLYQTLPSDFDEFEQLDISFYTSDKMKIILSISGVIITNYKNCLKKKKEISMSVKELLEGANYTYEDRNEKHGIDKTGKSKLSTSYFYLGDKIENKARDLVAVQCLDFSNHLPYDDALKLYVAKGEYVDWLTYEAYN